jgi:hypothetical protein
MADLSVTETDVKATANTEIARGTAGAQVTALQPLYEDAGDDYKLKPAEHTSADTAEVVGVALHASEDDQPIAYATDGDLEVGNILEEAITYVLGANPGGISASADLDASSDTRYGSIIGIAASDSTLRLAITNSGVKHP